MKKIAVVLALVTLILGGTGALYAASSIYGLSGLIETPDDTIATPSSVALTANSVSDFDNTKIDFTTYGGVVGVIPNLEIGGVAVDIDANGVETEGLLNAKFKLLGESLDKPSITVGVVDAAKRLDRFTSISDASTFVVFGKNLSALAEGISGRVSKPVRGTFGFGTGLYKGIFAGLNWSAAPKFNVVVEYLSNGLRQDSTANAAIRFQPISALSIEAGTLGFEDFYAGASFSMSTF